MMSIWPHEEVQSQDAVSGRSCFILLQSAISLAIKNYHSKLRNSTSFDTESALAGKWKPEEDKDNWYRNWNWITYVWTCMFDLDEFMKML